MAENVALKLPDLVDIPRLEGWLDANLPDLGAGPLKVELVHGGTSNVILSLNRGGKTVMLRRPPPTPPPGSEKAIAREGRVLSALNGTDVPHPKVFAVCNDPQVIGAGFYVMERVDGWAGQLTDDDTVYPAPFDKAPYRYGIGFALADAFVKLANVDYKAVGLDGFGKPDGFLARQADRWSSQLASYKALYDWDRKIPGVDYVADWLRANTPPDAHPAIIHGDVGSPNTLFAFEAPCRVNALIDWELSTIGDPMLDLTWFASGLNDEREPGVNKTHGSFNPRGFPTRQALARYYAAGTGRDVANFDYYLVLALFKNVCIVEYKVAQAAQGSQPDWVGKFFNRLVLARTEEAERIARRAG